MAEVGAVLTGAPRTRSRFNQLNLVQLFSSQTLAVGESLTAIERVFCSRFAFPGVDTTTVSVNAVSERNDNPCSVLDQYLY